MTTAMAADASAVTSSARRRVALKVKKVMKAMVIASIEMVQA